MLKRIFVISGLIASLLFIPAPVVTIAASDSLPQPNRGERTSIWKSLFRSLTRSTPVPRRPGGGRDSVDLLTPGVWASEVWTLQPMLIWQSDGTPANQPSQVEIISHDGQTILRQSVQAAEFVVLPVKQPLQPGQLYRVQFLKWSPVKNQEILMMPPIEFRVMAGEERQKIAQQLSQAEARLRERPATFAEILQKRIQVFVDHQMWSDALQEIHSSNLPVAERQALMQEVVKHWSKMCCKN